MRYARPAVLAILFVVAGSLVALTACGDRSPGPASSGQPVYVALPGAGALAKLGGPLWPVAQGTQYDSVTAAGNTVLVTSSLQNKMYALDPFTGNTIGSVDVGQAPRGVNISPDDRLAIVANERDGTITMIGLPELVVLKTLPVGREPHNVAYSPHNKLAYVTLQADDQLVTVDLAAMEVTGRLAMGAEGVPDGPHNLDIAPGGDRLYISLRYTDLLAVIDLRTNQVLKYVPLTRGHHGVDVSPDGRWVYVAGIGAAQVNVIDAATLERVALIDVGEGPHGLRASADGKLLYVSCSVSDEVVVVDTVARRVMDRFAFSKGASPFWVALPGNR